jgi:HlyD family secretion protein
MPRRTLWILVVVAVAALAAFVVARRGPQPITVDLATVASRDRLQSFVTASGEVVAARYADIGSNAMGRILELPVVEGQPVTAGQLLARLDAVPAESEVAAASAQLAALEAEVVAARARAAETEQALLRTEALHAQALAPPAELDAARAAHNTATAQVAAAEKRAEQGRAQLARSRDALGKTAITSPLDGVVTRLAVRLGEMVVIGVQNQPGTILMTVSDLSELDIEVKVAEADMPRLRVEQPAWATFEALPGVELAGRVVAIGASALPLVGTASAAREFEVQVRLGNPDPRLRPGLTGDVRILTEEVTDVLTVPLQAVVLRPGADGKDRTGVFVAEAAERGARARFVEVATGILGGLDVAVTGVPADAKVVAGPFQVLRDLDDGALVRERQPK